MISFAFLAKTTMHAAVCTTALWVALAAAVPCEAGRPVRSWRRAARCCCRCDVPPLRRDAPSNETRLFDGRSLAGWRVIEQQDFADHGEVGVEDGRIVMRPGSPATGIAWKGEFPRSDYEVSLEAMRVEGSDFFCGMTFPVGESYCTLIVGGWGGSVVGLSNVDGYSAAENETTRIIDAESNRWYAIRLQVTETHVRVWIDGEPTVELERSDRRFSIWWEQEPVRPFGIASWHTGTALRAIRLTKLPAVP